MTDVKHMRPSEKFVRRPVELNTKSNPNAHTGMSNEARAAYLELTRLSEKILENPTIVSHPGAEAYIERKVAELYAQHKGEPAWEIAYRKWCEQ